MKKKAKMPIKEMPTKGEMMAEKTIKKMMKEEKKKNMMMDKCN